MNFIFKTCCLGIVLSAGLATLPASAEVAYTDTLDAATLLEKSKQELMATIPGIQAARKPVLGPHGMHGQWVLPNTAVAGLPFDSTFFIHNGQVKRVEQLWTSVKPGCEKHNALAEILTTMKRKYGNEQASTGFAESGYFKRSAAWVAGSVDVAVHFSTSSTQCSTRLVFQPHLVKDASEL